MLAAEERKDRKKEGKKKGNAEFETLRHDVNKIFYT